MTRIATDIGGTFTDLVYVSTDGTAKSHTTAGHFEQDVIAASGVARFYADRLWRWWGHARLRARHRVGHQEGGHPQQFGGFSAWGMLLSDLRRDYLQTQVVELSVEGAAQQLTAAYSALEEQAMTEYTNEGIDAKQVHYQRYGRLRYQNQEHFDRG